MGNPEIDIPRLAIADAKKVFHADFETIDSRRRLRRDAARFGHNQTGAIFVLDIKTFRMNNGFSFRIRSAVYETSRRWPLMIVDANTAKPEGRVF